VLFNSTTPGWPSKRPKGAAGGALSFCRSWGGWFDNSALIVSQGASRLRVNGGRAGQVAALGLRKGGISGLRKKGQCGKGQKTKKTKKKEGDRLASLIGKQNL
jgi:hypothetical protein